jgi:hypothetical protein
VYPNDSSNEQESVFEMATTTDSNETEVKVAPVYLAFALFPFEQLAFQSRRRTVLAPLPLPWVRLRLHLSTQKQSCY